MERNAEIYRVYAVECLHWAARSQGALEREALLQIAETWTSAANRLAAVAAARQASVNHAFDFAHFG